MPKEDGGRNSIEGCTQIREDGESVPIRRCGGGQRTCWLALRPAHRGKERIMWGIGAIMELLMIPAYANDLFLTTERRSGAKRVRKQPGADPARCL